ncbi:MAG: four-helix bundle copper-binding protein [Gemmatimonadaceae bacterium]|nr:four-helix bundle copper-binding protein [Gloeobacterales cyanobacterium ES-bin-141]
MQQNYKPQANLSEQMEQCIQDCLDCHRLCLGLVTHCLSMGGEHAEAAHIRLLLDCAQMAQTATDFMTRNSELHGRICLICAEVCEHCAQNCEQLMDDDAQMKACAEACRRAANSCQKMVYDSSALGSYA